MVVLSQAGLKDPRQLLSQTGAFEEGLEGWAQLGHGLSRMTV